MPDTSVEFGLSTFGDVTLGADGRPQTHAQVIRNVVAEAVLADSVGIDLFAVGEHHRDDFAISAPEIVLGVIAGQTRRIRLSSSVTVLSSDDPVRVFERFATLDAATNGRAGIIVGRGWYTEAFALFGYDVTKYTELFDEKLDLFVRLVRQKAVSWQGKYRSPLTNQVVYPPIEGGGLDTWIAVGATPESILRAARYELPMIIAVIGGEPARFAPFVALYKAAFAKLGKPVQSIGSHSTGYIADSDESARDELWPHYQNARNRISRERGLRPIERAQFDLEIARGSLFVGSPETVARRIAGTITTLGLSRFNLKYSAGTLPHEKLLRSIELYGTRVIPLVRNMLG